MTNRSHKLQRRIGSWALAAVVALGVGGARAWARPSSATVSRSAEPARAFLRVDLRAGGTAPHELYVGEAVPVTIRAYFLDGTGVSLNSQPRLASDGLTLSNLSDKPVQSSAQLAGFPYTVVTWTGRLTAARAGAARSDVELPVELSYREPPRGLGGPNTIQPGGNGQPDQDEGANDDADGDANDPFSSLLKQTPLANDPFFRQMFKGGDPFAGMMRDLAGTIRQREVTLRGPGASVRVLDLPSPQPPGFTGAVGRFEIAAALSPGPYRVGEPATLRLTVTGRGSFSRLSLAGPPSTPALTTYATTVASPPGGDNQKVFTETVVPRRPGVTTVPAVTFTYFDPRARRYVSRRTPPIHIEVAAAAGETAATGASDSRAAGVRGTVAPGAPGGVATAEPAVPDVTRPTLTPLIHTRWFPLAGLGLGLVALVLGIVGRLSRRGTFARWREARRLRRELVLGDRALHEAARRGDAAALFEAARRTLQVRLGAAWGMPPEAIAAADVGRRLGPRGAQIREIFERADRLNYAGARPATEPDLERWPERISAELRALESST